MEQSREEVELNEDKKELKSEEEYQNLGNEEDSLPREKNQLDTIINAIEYWEENSKSIQVVSSKMSPTKNLEAKPPKPIDISNDEDIQSIYDNNIKMLKEIIEVNDSEDIDRKPKTHSRCVNELLYEMNWIDKKSSEFSEEFLFIKSQSPRNNERLLQIYKELLIFEKLLHSKENSFLQIVPNALKALESKIYFLMRNIEILIIK